MPGVADGPKDVERCFVAQLGRRERLLIAVGHGQIAGGERFGAPIVRFASSYENSGCGETVITACHRMRKSPTFDIFINPIDCAKL